MTRPVPDFARPLPLLAAMVLLAFVVVIAVEWFWRERGYEPVVAFDQDLWSAQRAVASRPGAWALLGASRMQLAFDRETFEATWPGCPLANLTVNGHYPLAALRDLAGDEQFDGTALVSLDARAMLPLFDEMQQPHVQHYQRAWSPERRLNRWLKTRVQQRLVVANPEHNWVTTLRRQLDGLPPVPWRYITVFPDGLVAADYEGIDVAGFERFWAEGLETFYAEHPPQPAEQWLAAAARMRPWIDAIERRGGRVVLLRLPTSGAHYAVDAANYPRERYWDQVSEALDVPTLHFEDVAAIAALETPDSSHIDGRDRPIFTAALLQALDERFGVGGCPPMRD